MPGERKDIYYTVQAMINGKWNDENPDPYAKAVGVNGKRGQIIDLNETNPAGWENDQSPAMKQRVDAILYEIHVRDLSMAAIPELKIKANFWDLQKQEPKTTRGKVPELITLPNWESPMYTCFRPSIFALLMRQN